MKLTKDQQEVAELLSKIWIDVCEGDFPDYLEDIFKENPEFFHYDGIHWVFIDEEFETDV